MFVSVNLSVKQFNQPGLVENIASLLEQFQLPPRCLKLEITESVFSDNIEAAVGLLTQLRELGVQLSIDDFGTGYSSLSYLQRFPIDTLKIDRSFVTQMMENEENLAIVRTIVALAQNLGMDVVAEGVETEDQLRLLRKLECENGQGYLFSTPLGGRTVESVHCRLRHRSTYGISGLRSISRAKTQRRKGKTSAAGDLHFAPLRLRETSYET